MSLKRLTRWNEQTEQAELVAYNTEEWKDFKNSLDILDDMEIMNAINKLAEYEDLNEDKIDKYHYCPGDLIWCIDGDDCFGALFMAECDPFIIACGTYYEFEDLFSEQLIEMYDESMDNDYEINVLMLNKGNVFKSKEDAEEEINKRMI